MSNEYKPKPGFNESQSGLTAGNILSPGKGAFDRPVTIRPDSRPEFKGKNYYFLPELPDGLPETSFRDKKLGYEEFWRKFAEHRLELIFLLYQEAIGYVPTGAALPPARFDSLMQSLVQRVAVDRRGGDTTSFEVIDVTKKHPSLEVVRFHNSYRGTESSFYEGLTSYNRFNLKFGNFASGDESIHGVIPLDLRPKVLSAAVVASAKPYDDYFPPDSEGHYLVAPHIVLPERLSVEELQSITGLKIDASLYLKDLFGKYVNGVTAIKTTEPFEAR